jgi:hypothetical protein
MPELTPSGKTSSALNDPNSSYKLDSSKPISGVSYKLEDFMSNCKYSAPTYRSAPLQRAPLMQQSQIQDTYRFQQGNSIIQSPTQDNYNFQQRPDFQQNPYNSRRLAA